MSTKKNSGILRYTFGPSASHPEQGQLPSVGLVAAVIQCLGAGADVLTPDQDDQLFGPSPGHDAVPGFSGAPALLAQPGDTLSAATARSHERVYIPASTKVFAFFQPTDTASLGAVAVRTQVVNSPIRDAVGIVDPSLVAPLYLAAIRVSVQAFGNVAALVQGVLIVELQHSEHDIPGIATQDQDAALGG